MHGATHRLDQLLRPRSLAVIGASRRDGSVGNRILVNLLEGGYRGRLHAVNPGYESVLGLRALPSLDALPEPVEHAILAVSDERVEEAFEQAIGHGVRAATILGSLALEGGGAPPLKERIRRRAGEAGILLIGGNTMGFLNFTDGVRAGGFPTRNDHRAGGISLLTQSGSVQTALVDCDSRLDFNLVVSTGQELGATIADHLDFALDMPTTRVVGLFLESVRDPDLFRRCLAKAQRRRIPIVALKVGRTERSARLAESHSGALTGNDAVYDALFERWGVARVETLDEMAATLLLFDKLGPPGPGALASIHDSGGERELLIEQAEALEVPFAILGNDTVSRLRSELDPGLTPENPLDAWGTGHDWQRKHTACLTALLDDPATALAAIVCDRAPGGELWPEYREVAERAREATGKPVLVATNHQGTGPSDMVVEWTRAGIPVLDGIRPLLLAARHLFAYRDTSSRSRPEPSAEASPPALERWRRRLGSPQALAEAEALAFLEACGLPVVPHVIVESASQAIEAALELGFPVALKTARSDLLHKSEEGGVVLGVRDEEELRDRFGALARRHGESVIVARMVVGAEVLLGATCDEQFGPVMIVGGGGRNVEFLGDTVWALPPLDAAAAGRLLERLRVGRIVAGVRGAAPCDREALVEVLVNFSKLAVAFAEHLGEIEINPLVVTERGCCAADALFVPSAVRRGKV